MPFQLPIFMPLPMLQNNSSLNPANLLSQLPPLALPNPVSWWPIAIGWWLLLALVFTAAGLALLLIRRHYRSTRLIKSSRQTLNTIYLQYSSNQNSIQYLSSCNQLIRSFCLKQYHCNKLAVLSGEQWLKALDNIVSNPSLNSTEGKQLLQHYQLNTNVDIEALHNLLVRWFKAVPKQLKAQQIKSSPNHAV